MSRRDEDPPDRHGLVKVLQTITPNVVRRSFAIKFGLVLLLLAVSIGAIGLVATDRISAESQQNVENEYRNVAAQEAGIIEEWLERNQLSVRLSSQNPVWSQSDPQDLRLDLENERSRLGSDVVEMHLVDTENGAPVVAASTSLDSGTEFADTERDWIGGEFDTLRNLQTSDVYTSNTYSTGSESTVGFVSPTSAQQGRYLLVEVSVSEIGAALQGQERAEGGFTQVVDTETQTIQIDERGEEALSPYAESTETLEPVRRAADLTGTDRQAGVIAEMPANSDVMDETYTVGFAPVEGTDWVVVTHAPRSSVFGFVQTVSNFGLLVTFAAVLVIGVVGTALGYSTSRSIDRLTKKTERMREEDLDVSFSTTRIDNIGRLYDSFAELRDELKEQISDADRARKEAEVSRAEAEEMTNYLQEKAEEYSEIMQQCGGGDLTQRMEPDGENDSMDRIAEEFNEMIEELEKTTGQLKSYVDEVEDAGREVERSATTVRTASEQVADSIQKIAVDAENQKEHLQYISETIDDVVSDLEALANEEDVSIDEPLENIRSIADDINDITRLSEETQAETDNVSAAAEQQAAELSEVSERANDLQRYAQPLRDILERFDTEAEHEFVFSVGPTGSGVPANRDEEDE